MCCSFQLGVFVGLGTVGEYVSLIVFLALRTLWLLLGCLVQPRYKDYFLILLLSCFVVFDCCLFGGLLFSEGKHKGSWSGEEGNWGEMGRNGGRGTLFGMYSMRGKSIFNLKNEKEKELTIYLHHSATICWQLLVIWRIKCFWLKDKHWTVISYMQLLFLMN